MRVRSCGAGRSARRSCRRRSARRCTAPGTRAGSSRACNAATRRVCASGVRATTMQAAGVLVEAVHQPGARHARELRRRSASSACCSVWRRLPAPGCTTRPGGLVQHDERRDPRTRYRAAWPRARAKRPPRIPPPASRAPRPQPARSASRARRRRPSWTRPSRIQRWMREREYCGSAVASAWSSRWPAALAGSSRSWVWNLAGMRRVAEAGRSDSLYCLFYAQSGYHS